MKIWLLGAAGLLLIGRMAVTEEPAPVGNEFQVNSYTTSTQERAAVAADAQGNFVVVWQSQGSSDTDTSFRSVQAQRFDAHGSQVGGQFQVNSYTTNNQDRPAVAVDAQGNFVVVWHSAGSYGNDSSGASIQGQRFDASGARVGVEFQINSYTTSTQAIAALDMHTDGDFVVAWTSYGSYGTDSYSLSVQAQLFEADGTAVGGQFQVNSYTTGYQRNADVIMDAQGGFVVVWESSGSSGTDSSSFSVQGQRYDSDGVPIGGEFQVNSYTPNKQQTPAIGGDAQGNFVVTWESDGSFDTDQDEESIQAQLFDATGTPVGEQFQVNSYTREYQLAPAVSFDGQANFIVVWDSDGSVGSDQARESIQAQWYTAGGAASGEQFQVNHRYTANGQTRPAVALDNLGQIVVVWQSEGSYGSDHSDESIQAQLYLGPIFVDGFESGDASAWGGMTP